jgi:hypothetical protein
VDAGIGGMDLMTSFKMSKMENFLERVYNGCGELMILNNSIENVKKIVGSRAVWSIVLGDKESDVLSSQVKQEAMELAYQQSLNQALTTGKQIDVPTLSALISEIEGQILIEKIGIPFIISRNSIFKNLQVGISVSMDKNADKYQKLSALQTLMTSLQLGAQAGMQSGLRFNPEPLLMGLSSIFGLDADLSRIYEQDISMELQSIAQQISMNPGLLTPQFMSAIQGIIGIISQIQGGVNNGDRTRKGNESSGAKARGDASSQGR